VSGEVNCGYWKAISLFPAMGFTRSTWHIHGGEPFVRKRGQRREGTLSRVLLLDKTRSGGREDGGSIVLSPHYLLCKLLSSQYHRITFQLQQLRFPGEGPHLLGIVSESQTRVIFRAQIPRERPKSENKGTAHDAYYWDL